MKNANNHEDQKDLSVEKEGSLREIFVFTLAYYINQTNPL